MASTLSESRAGALRMLCWGLIAVARALEVTRLAWNTIWFERLDPDGLFLWRTCRGHTDGRCGVMLFTLPGRVLLRACSWMHTAAVSLTRLANRGLPPLGPDGGFLARLYASPRFRRT
jgi:hypothetical protein